MGQAVAIGTAVGSGRDPSAIEASARKSGEASRTGLEENMRAPLRRYLAYSYRNLSDADLKHLLAFLESPRASVMCPPTSPRWGPGSTPWAGAAANSSGKACVNWPRHNWTYPPPVRHPHREPAACHRSADPGNASVPLARCKYPPGTPEACPGNDAPTAAAPLAAAIIIRTGH